MSNNVYSYHTFFYPFLLNKEDTMESFCKEIEKTSCWNPDFMSCNGDNALSVVDTNDFQQAKLDYQTFQYFNPSARQALFQHKGSGSDFSVVKCYQYTDARGGEYLIQNGNGDPYSLYINGIRLKVFNTNVAVIIFETEYRLPAEGAAKARKDILQINEFGRRVYPEFLAADKNGFLLCADVLTIKLTNGKAFADRFRDNAQPTENEKWQKNPYLAKPTHLPNIITGLLGISKTDKIRPAIDSRMFVCCCVNDNDYVNHFLGYKAWPDSKKWSEDEKKAYNHLHRQSHQWEFMNNWENGCELYALLNVDAGGSSCQNRVMLDQYLEEQLYPRWLEVGTLHAVTNHSMFCLTSPSVYSEVILPFLIEYIPMAILVQVQRASLLAFDERITRVLQNKDTMLDELIRLQEDFARFQGQLLLEEVTPQIQGIEIYEKMQKMLFVDKLYQSIQQRLNMLYEIAQANIVKREEEAKEVEKSKTRWFGVALSALALLNIISVACDLSGLWAAIIAAENPTSSQAIISFFAVFGLVILIAFISWLIFRPQKTRKKEKK